MFDSLQDRLGKVFQGLTRRASLSESDVTAALREVRVALLEADVALKNLAQAILQTVEHLQVPFRRRSDCTTV